MNFKTRFCRFAMHWRGYFFVVNRDTEDLVVSWGASTLRQVSLRHIKDGSLPKVVTFEKNPQSLSTTENSHGEANSCFDHVFSSFWHFSQCRNFWGEISFYRFEVSQAVKKNRGHHFCNLNELSRTNFSLLAYNTFSFFMTDVTLFTPDLSFGNFSHAMGWCRCSKTHWALSERLPIAAILHRWCKIWFAVEQIQLWQVWGSFFEMAINEPHSWALRHADANHRCNFPHVFAWVFGILFVHHWNFFYGICAASLRFEYFATP